MGASLVLAALDAARRVGLGDSPTRLLVRFAVSARDDDAEPWARLTMTERCAALGREDDDAGRWAVKRATAAIIRAGLATLAEGGNRSGAARYSLALSENGGRSAHPIESGKVGAQRSKGGRSALRMVGAQRTPKEDRGDTEETRASAPLPLTCPRHPDGNASEPCRTCGDVRRARDALPTVSAPFTVQPGAAHPGIDHKRVPDGTCALCDARPEVVAADLAREGIAWPTTR